MTRSLLRARSLLSLVIASALAPMACLTDDPERLDESDDLDDADDGVDEAPPSWRSLVHDDAWQPTLAEDDPRLEHRPAVVECEDGWYLESEGIEIDTGACNYLSLQQPLTHALEPGDPLRLQLWWQALASVDPAEGHLAIFVDGERLWEEHVPIPGPAAVRSLEFESPLGAPTGATLTLHLHNHGYNTWHFHELSALGSRP
jgi:hypothetical protein